MDIIKKNILSIICGAVALVALIALVWPVGGMYADTQAKLELSKKADTDLVGLPKIQRAWPVIPELETGAQAKLNRFPNDDLIKAGTAIKDAVHKQAADMKSLTAANNEHFLLVPDVLPNPRDLDLRFRFQQAYMEMVQKTLRAQMQGTSPPTDQDVLDAANQLFINKYKGQIINVLGKNVNEEQKVAEWQTECAGLQAKIRLQTAQKAKVYIEPDWLTIQGKMPNNPAGPGIVDIWYAQNMLWVQKDLVDAMARINGSAHDVTDAPIKHIFRIEVPDGQGQYVEGGATGGAAPSPTDMPGKAYAVSPTGRVCNPLYDVLQFQLVMNVDAHLVPSILAQLQTSKLITVQQFDLSAVDGIAAADDGYVYGDVPVVRLTIRGEELFLRDWTVKLMPDQIKSLLQVPADSAKNP